MKLKKNISLLQTSVMALVTGMMFSCTGDLEEKSEFTSDPIVINLVSAADADIMPIAGTRSLSEDEHPDRCVLVNKSGDKMHLSCVETPWPSEKAATRGTKVIATDITNIGVSASIYPSSSSYTSAGCGSYFYKESITIGTPTKFYWPTSDYRMSFYAYYPYGNSAFTVQSAASATGHPTYAYTVPTAIGSQVDVMTASQTDIAGGSSSPVNLSFSHQCAAIKVRITNSTTSSITVNSVSIEGVEYTGTLCNGTWTLSGTKNNSSVNPFTLTCNTAVAASATADLTGTTNIFLMLPQTLTSSAKLKMVIDSEEYEAELSGSWQAGKTYTYSVTKEQSDTSIDLSMVDNAGNARASMMTANCYLVHAAGDYKLPLVYGNAIKNGTDNRVAYYPGDNTSISNLATNQFVNHAGTGISGPWITKSTSNTGINKGMGITVASAELLWQDVTGLISAVGVDGDYLTFTVGTFNGGNALIAVKDGSGNILWSWHIWATTETLTNTTTIATGDHNYAVAPVLLGWVPTGGGGKQGYCPYYQWGRKDPFVPCNGVTNGNVDKTVYNINGTSVTGFIFSTTDVDIAGNIKNPTIFYSSRNRSVTTQYINMWDAQNTASNTVSSPTKKTIYDPCPPGFCVPTGNLFYFMGNGTSERADSNWDYTYNGKTWTLNGANVYFPAVGQRRYDSGALNSVGTHILYWSAVPANKASNTNASCVYLQSNKNSWYFSYTTTTSVGFPILMAVEE